MDGDGKSAAASSPGTRTDGEGGRERKPEPEATAGEARRRQLGITNGWERSTTGRTWREKRTSSGSSSFYMRFDGDRWQIATEIGANSEVGDQISACDRRFVFQLPFALIPVLQFTGDPRIMKSFTNGRWVGLVICLFVCLFGVVVRLLREAW